MTEREAFSIIRNVIRLEGVARRIAVESSKELRRALKTVREVIANMPEGSVERELAYKQLRDYFLAVMERPTDALQLDTAAGLQAEAPYQADWARRYIDVDAPLDNSLTRAALAGVEQAKVADKPLDTIFKGLKRAQWKRVDAIVREGFLTGMSNNQIANALGGSIKGLQSQQTAIARTAVMSMAGQAHNAVWDANADVIEGWVIDASMDYRVCPVCAPLDGRKAKKRSDLPFNGIKPFHVRCRCDVLPITGIDTDTGDRSMVVLMPDEDVIIRRKGKVVYDGKADKRRFDSLMNAKDVRIYETPVVVDGKKRTRVAIEFAPQGGKAMSMGEMLNRTTHEMQAQVLGSHDAAEQFRVAVANRGADNALRDVTRFADRKKKKTK